MTLWQGSHPLVLASKSASRQAMLRAAGIAFDAIPAEVDERTLEAEMTTDSPAIIAGGLARAKAAAVCVEKPGRLVLGSDSLVEVDGRRFDKPADRAAAAEHLRYFSGKVMHLHSAAALLRDGECLWSDAAEARLHLRTLSPEFIDLYLEREWPEVGHCVGVFRIEGLGAQLFERIEGDQFTVLGMPLLAVLAGLRDLGELPA